MARTRNPTPRPTKLGRPRRRYSRLRSFSERCSSLKRLPSTSSAIKNMKTVMQTWASLAAEACQLLVGHPSKHAQGTMPGGTHQALLTEQGSLPSEWHSRYSQQVD